MNNTEFEVIKNEFSEADTEKKVTMYVDAEGLTQEQYKELLKLFPLNQISKLEEAMQ